MARKDSGGGTLSEEELHSPDSFLEDEVNLFDRWDFSYLCCDVSSIYIIYDILAKCTFYYRHKTHFVATMHWDWSNVLINCLWDVKTRKY